MDETYDINNNHGVVILFFVFIIRNQPKNARWRLKNSPDNSFMALTERESLLDAFDVPSFLPSFISAVNYNNNNINENNKALASYLH